MIFRIGFKFWEEIWWIAMAFIKSESRVLLANLRCDSMDNCDACFLVIWIYVLGLR
jgi:hypothetical protein